MLNGTKKWAVTYDHKDGRKGTVEVKTTIEDSQAFKYGNGKCGGLFVDGFSQAYDLRYFKGGDAHMWMIRDIFGDGLVDVREL